MNLNKSYQICVRCVMDTSDPDIVFDERGICNHCKFHEERIAIAPFSAQDSAKQFETILERIRGARRGEYDSIIGLSGGVDSSYLAYLAVKNGLRPLAVHFDNGWNSELAVKNIENIVKHLDIDLHTYVIDWEEFRDIQRSFFAANVIDIEMVTDHAIFAAIFSLAVQHNVHYVLAGSNAATESIMPASWLHFKMDLRNLSAIQKRFGTLSIRNFPTMSIWKMAWYHYVRKIRLVSLLNYVCYKKQAAMNVLRDELGWKYYGGKHYESSFTHFYQAYILPKKFGVDKRRAHFSDLILNGEMTREQALEELVQPLCEPGKLEADSEFVCKKLGFSHEEFERYLTAPAMSHYNYPSHAKLAAWLMGIRRRLL